MPVTKPQADMLATLACAARPHGARQWDAAGVVAAVGKVKHLQLADVALAVFRAADDRTLETPGAIGNPAASCWRERAAGRTTPPDKIEPSDRCGICSEHREKCRRIWSGDHEFEPDFRHKRDGETAAQIAAALKAEVQPTTPPPERKTLDDLLPAQRDPRADVARGALAGNDAEETDE